MRQPLRAGNFGPEAPGGSVAAVADPSGGRVCGDDAAYDACMADAEKRYKAMTHSCDVSSLGETITGVLFCAALFSTVVLGAIACGVVFGAIVIDDAHNCYAEAHQRYRQMVEQCTADESERKRKGR